MVAERKRVSRLVNKETSTYKDVPLPPYHREKGDEWVQQNIKSNFIFLLCLQGLLKPTGNVGQRAHIRFIQRFSQFRNTIKFTLFDYMNLVELLTSAINPKLIQSIKCFWYSYIFFISSWVVINITEIMIHSYR